MKDSKFVEERQVLDTLAVVDDNYTLGPNEEEVIVDIPAGNIAITLGDVSECRGREVSILVRTAGGGTLTVQAGADAKVAYSDTIEDANDRLLMKCKGGIWWPLVKVEAD